MRCLLFAWLPSRQCMWGVALAAALLTACSSGGGKDAAADANAQNQQKIGAADVTAKQEADAKFLVKATSNALLEVELGKLAQARASAAPVRAYGARLVQNRLELLATLRALATAKGLTLPLALGDDEQSAYHEASVATGTQLDKHAMDLLVKTQKQDEDAFDDLKDDAYDGDIRGFAAKYLRPIQDQLAAAKEADDAADALP